MRMCNNVYLELNTAVEAKKGTQTSFVPAVSVLLRHYESFVVCEGLDLLQGLRPTGFIFASRLSQHETLATKLPHSAESSLYVLTPCRPLTRVDMSIRTAVHELMQVLQPNLKRVTACGRAANIEKRRK